MRTRAAITFSCPPELEEVARARAKSLRLSFSKYVQVLLDQDVRRGGSLSITLETAPELAPFGLNPMAAAETQSTIYRARRAKYEAQAATAGLSKEMGSSA